MNKRVIIITGAGLVIGFAEALIYYNMGKQQKGKAFSYAIPSGKELGQTLAAVAITSILTAALSNGLEKLLTQQPVTA
ncbi:MAG: hypothetical protein CMD31_13165 [Flavobacteriales bacterium]|nr:hypothetical protein [Flavobacteriales bacterium]